MVRVWSFPSPQSHVAHPSVTATNVLMLPCQSARANLVFICAQRHHLDSRCTKPGFHISQHVGASSVFLLFAAIVHIPAESRSHPDEGEV